MGIPADQLTVLSRQTLSMWDIQNIQNVLTTRVHLNQCYKDIFIVIMNFSFCQGVDVVSLLQHS